MMHSLSLLEMGLFHSSGLSCADGSRNKPSSEKELESLIIRSTDIFFYTGYRISAPLNKRAPP